MKKIITVICICFGITGFALVYSGHTGIGEEYTLKYFKTNAAVFAASAKELKTSIIAISDKDSATIFRAREQLGICRQKYKSIEFFIEYFLGNRIAIFNLAPVYEIEEPFMEYQSPVGLQVIEGLLFDNDVQSAKKEMIDNINVVIETADGLNAFLYGKKISDNELLESIRLELIRISTLGITGYDAPLLKSGISEAKSAMLSVRDNIRPFLVAAPGLPADSISFYVQLSIKLLSNGSTFDAFDRMVFLTDAMLPLQKQVGIFARQLNMFPGKNSVLNYGADDIFKPGALNINAFDSTAEDASKALIRLGKKLLAEPMLSGNGNRSCITCHMPEKYFTDGLKKSIAFDDHSLVRRNAPSLLYSAYQFGNFWDARAKTLEDQILDVVVSANEMNADFAIVTKRLEENKNYRRLFKQAFPLHAVDKRFSAQNIATAIAAYERSLPVMTSAFDKYIAGDKTALTPEQLSGFNLFMGKAQCGTCHFAPLFNSLLPPYYAITELESLGVTQTEDFNHPQADADSGRYHVFPIEFYTGVFKTPTVRNVAKTAPYMHNGSLPTLKAVVEFYNKGGGNGLGLHNPYQTLPDRPLNLTGEEEDALIKFMEALTDEPLWLYR
ncbi:MAG: cytochrome c peroxidase [Agriterribacter sp.]